MYMYHKTRSTSSLFMEVPVSILETLSARSCICLVRISILPLSRFFHFYYFFYYFGTVPTVWQLSTEQQIVQQFYWGLHLYWSLVVDDLISIARLSSPCQVLFPSYIVNSKFYMKTDEQTELKRKKIETSFVQIL